MPTRPRSHAPAFCAAAILLSLSAAVLPASPARAWGNEGHAHVARIAVESLPEPLKGFYGRNRGWFEQASSLPDRWRNRPDKAEAPRHFLDTENFGFGRDMAKVPRRFSEAVKLRGYEQLRKDGVNPWTVRKHYGLLVRALREKRWDDVMLQSAYLSHYVGDAHVPFHASSNYDGQLSQPAQKGIHSRFESRVVARFVTIPDLKPGAPEKIGDPLEATFATLQESVNAVEEILTADTEALKAAGKDPAKAQRSDYNDAYFKAFAAKARPVAVARLEKGGRSLAGYLVKAWEEAGKPALPSDFEMTDRFVPYAPAFGNRAAASVPPKVADEVKQAARARAEVIQIPSKALKRDAPVTVLLPKDYATSGLRYPVLYLLHGASGAHGDWNARSGIAAYTEDLPLIVVMPDAGGNSFYTNTPGMGAVNDYFEKELIAAIDAKYRTIAAREGRAIAGLSMGGYGAWRIGLDRPQDFCAAASLSGALLWGEGQVAQNGPNPFAQALYGKDTDPAKMQEMYAQDGLMQRIRSLSDGKGGWKGPALYLDCGAEDFILQHSRMMEEALLDRAVPHEYTEFNGKHDWPYWDEHVRDVLQFVRRHVAAPR
jgi:Predicted esterase